MPTEFARSPTDTPRKIEFNTQNIQFAKTKSVCKIHFQVFRNKSDPRNVQCFKHFPVSKNECNNAIDAAARLRYNFQAMWRTKQSEPAPANPPDAMLIAKNVPKFFLGSTFGKRFLMVSLKAKLNACVGKYRRMFVKLPRQNAPNPCSLYTRLKQLPIPV